MVNNFTVAEQLRRLARRLEDLAEDVEQFGPFLLKEYKEIMRVYNEPILETYYVLKAEGKFSLIPAEIDK